VTQVGSAGADNRLPPLQDGRAGFVYAALALLLAVGSLPAVWGLGLAGGLSLGNVPPSLPPTPAAAASVVFLTAPLLLCVRRPAVAAGAVLAALLGAKALGTTELPADLAVLVAFYALGLRAPGRPGVLSAAAACLATDLVLLLAPSFSGLRAEGAQAYVFVPAVLVLAPWALGRSNRAWRDRQVAALLHTLQTASATGAASPAQVAPPVVRLPAQGHGPATATSPARRIAQLTAREREVFDLLVTGMSNREISAELHITLETCKTHVRNILRKLEVRDRTQAVVLALGSGEVARD
jgi:DNA-binding CsgD family transcriptional regulator